MVNYFQLEERGKNMISKRLRQIRIEHKMTQQNIADVLGIDRTTYTFYETGVTKPSLVTLTKLADIYNVTVGYLLGVEKNNPELRVTPEDARADSQLQSSDPIGLLSREEKFILMCYRVLDEDGKKEASKIMKEFTRQYGKKLDE
ncbi:MAG: helix-turn-helix domain-containing protein [Acutalibacteraceae bacterium]